MRGLKQRRYAGIDYSAAASHPSRVRGLKQQTLEPERERSRVAPFTGAWIETVLEAVADALKRLSHPSRVRGLKLDARITHAELKEKSHPSRVRGLKHRLQLLVHPWPPCRTLHGCVD